MKNISEESLNNAFKKVEKIVGRDKIKSIKYVMIKKIIVPEYHNKLRNEGNEKILEKSIVRHGYVAPIIVNKNPNNRYVLIDGKNRLEYYKANGAIFITAIVLNVSEAKAKELFIILNEQVTANDRENIKQYLENCTLEEVGIFVSMENYKSYFDLMDDNLKKQRNITHMKFALLNDEAKIVKDTLEELKTQKKLPNQSIALLTLIKKYNETNIN